jgi:hypothetical protein
MPHTTKNIVTIIRNSASANIKPGPFFIREMKAFNAKKATIIAAIKERIPAMVNNAARVFFIS